MTQGPKRTVAQQQRIGVAGAPLAGRLGCVQRFTSYDDTELAYHLAGPGHPLVCLPGGPGRASDYLGDLGGLAAHRQLVLLDHRGTGASATPAEVASYRCDRLVDDVEASGPIWDWMAWICWGTP
jgi:pimeloyl-ACP methyl ester carboxylesterase